MTKSDPTLLTVFGAILIAMWMNGGPLLVLVAGAVLVIGGVGLEIWRRSDV